VYSSALVTGIEGNHSRWRAVHAVLLFWAV